LQIPVGCPIRLAVGVKGKELCSFMKNYTNVDTVIVTSLQSCCAVGQNW
jgi:hypothetical protein